MCRFVSSKGVAARIADAAPLDLAMPVIGKALDRIREEFPCARWSLEWQEDEGYILLHLYLDVENSWTVSRVARPLLNEAAPGCPPIAVVTHPASDAGIRGVFTSPI